MVGNLLTTDYKKISSSKFDLVNQKLEKIQKLLKAHINELDNKNKSGSANSGVAQPNRNLADDAENVGDLM